MDTDRFLQFAQRIDAIQKVIQQLKLQYASACGVKSIHLFWLCELLRHPSGLTPATLAKRLHVDRSLISREIGELGRENYIVYVSQDGKRKYNTPIVLTERGKALAERIFEAALTVQRLTDLGLTESDLATFYRVSQKLLNNLTALAPVEEACGKIGIDEDVKT